MPMRSTTNQPARLGALEKLPAPALLIDLGIILALVSLPLTPEFPPALTAYLASIYALHLIGSLKLRLRTLHWLPPLLMVLGVVLVLKYYRTLVGYEAGIALYTVLLGTKLLEIRKLRDSNVTVIIGLFLIVLQFLLNQSLWRALFMLPLVVALVATLIQGNRVNPLPRIAVLKIALQLVAQALPMMIIVFVLFPRLAEPLWALSLKLDRLKARTGLSETMSPGSINGLINSPETAFRAEFQTQPLPDWLLYWRGPVFWHTSGLSWRGGPPHDLKPQPMQQQDGRVDYRIIMEPNGKRWVLALDLPINAPKGTEIEADYSVRARLPIDQRSQFFLTSYTNYHTGDISPVERTAALHTPRYKSVGRRLKNLVANWQTQAKGQPQLIIDQALEFFRSEHFVYSLNPPLLGANDVEDFLFNTKTGYCEHYAGAFAFLMRMAGIPSRVVTGYLGGEFNEIGQYYLVRQQDAHAWTEVWLENSGWVRIDPTAIVAPDRVRPGSTNATNTTQDLFGLGNITGLDSILRSLRLIFDTINTRWDMWVLSYDTKSQEALLNNLGLGFLDRLGVAIFMLLLAMGSGGALAWFLSQYRAEPKDIPTLLYRRLCSRLSKVGILRPEREGPQDFVRRVVRRRPDLAEEIEPIIALYIRINYSPRSLRTDLRTLRELIAAFRPKKRLS